MQFYFSPCEKFNLYIYISNQTFHFPGSAGSWKATESIQDRAFISLHCLPFTVAPELLEFAKWLSEERQALGKTTILKSNAYINTHGVAKSLKNDLKQKLKWQMLSLKADEATNNDKILNFIFFQSWQFWCSCSIGFLYMSVLCTYF